MWWGIELIESTEAKEDKDTVPFQLENKVNRLFSPEGRVGPNPEEREQPERQLFLSNFSTEFSDSYWIDLSELEDMKVGDLADLLNWAKRKSQFEIPLDDDNFVSFNDGLSEGRYIEDKWVDVVKPIQKPNRWDNTVEQLT